MPIPDPPQWVPKDKTSPLKEEYVLFYKEASRYHHLIEGALDEHPDLAAKLPQLPESLESFTEKMLIVIGASDLTMHGYKAKAVYDEIHRKRAEREVRSTTVSASPSTDRSRLKVALPTPFDGSAARARTFLAECKNYIDLSQSQFPSDHVKIQWALQLCTDKAANWKRIQLDLADGFETPDHLLDWRQFQQEFRLKWADLNAKKKARQRFLAGLKQTGSVRRYVELFEELVLEAEFHDEDVVTEAFRNGLKYEVRINLVGKTVSNLKELKAHAILLDEERTAEQDPTIRRDPRSKTMTSVPSGSESAPRSTPEIKAETARIGARLSDEERAKRLREGRCFGCGEHGHRHPDCPLTKASRMQVAAVETTAADSTPDPYPTQNESKN